jgi:hypothetical protein
MAVMTKTYRYPPSVAGGAVDPTAAQMVGHDRVVLDLSSTAAVNEDDTAVAHNMGLAVADGTDGTPECRIIPTTAGSVVSQLNMVFTDANTLTFQKVTKGANTTYVWRIVIKRPYSVGQ